MSSVKRLRKVGKELLCINIQSLIAMDHGLITHMLFQSIAVAGKEIIDEFMAVRKVENDYFASKDFEAQVFELYTSY